MEMTDLAESRGRKCIATSKTKAEKEGKKWRKNAESMWDHFNEIYGTRWETSLCRALLEPSKMCALMNPFVSNAEVVHVNQLEPIAWAPESMKAYISSDKTRLPAPIRDEKHGLPNYYCMDPASLLPVLALNLQSSPCPPIVLDLCGAPGGKTLAIHRVLSELGGGLVSNELSKIRRERLETVISEHIVDTTNVTVTCLDGVEFGNPNHDFSDLEGSLLDGTQALVFTHVLCDAPCSAERHILNHSSGGEWTGKSLRNTRRQIALLKAAWGACGDGGTIVYSTCSLSPAENDDIVTKLFSQRACKVQKLSFPIGEPTEHGWMILPDHQSSIGMGPIYMAAIQKAVEPT
jgi:16S rRNA C967 or C1407 C5-methylase (RsmB/RsmF family)